MCLSYTTCFPSLASVSRIRNYLFAFLGLSAISCNGSVKLRWLVCTTAIFGTRLSLRFIRTEATKTRLAWNILQLYILIYLSMCIRCVCAVDFAKKYSVELYHSLCAIFCTDAFILLALFSYLFHWSFVILQILSDREGGSEVGRVKERKNKLNTKRKY